MEKIDVVGVGPGSVEYITREAMKAVEKADVVVGGERNLAAFENITADKFIIKNNLPEMLRFIKNKKIQNKKVAILATGDPGMFGILFYLKDHFKEDEINVIPGISTVQFAFARLGMPWQDAVAVSTHGRDRAEFVNAVRQNKKVAVLPGPGEPPVSLAGALQEAGIKNKKIYICSELSYPHEKISSFSLEELVGGSEHWDKKNYVMVIVDE